MKQPEKQRPARSHKSQIEKFIDAAKAAETDDDPKRFAERVKKVSTAPPPHQPMQTKKKPAK